MKLQIPNYSDKLNKELLVECEFYHDVSGNLYMKIQNKYFVLMISASDDIEWIEVDNYENLPTVENSIIYSDIKNTYEKNSLKGKVTSELDEQNNNEDDEYVDEDGYIQNKHKVYPEEKLYTKEENNDENVDEDYEQFELQNHYKFSKFGNEAIIKCLDRSLEVLANYDTFIMNNNTSYVLTTLQAIEKSEYRVSLFVSGKMLLNVVGTKLNTYDLYYENKADSFEVKCEKLHTKFVL